MPPSPAPILAQASGTNWVVIVIVAILVIFLLIVVGSSVRIVRPYQRGLVEQLGNKSDTLGQDLVGDAVCAGRAALLGQDDPAQAGPGWHLDGCSVASASQKVVP